MEITVAGSGRASLTPERATVTLQIGFEGHDLGPVMEQTAALVAGVARAVDELEARDPSPTTWSAVLPTMTRSWVPYEDGAAQPTRFSASAEVKVTFQDFVELARFIAEHGAHEGVRVDQVEWTLTDETKAETEASVLSDAVSDARRRAEIVARSGGSGSIRLVEVADPGLLRDTRTDDSSGGGRMMRSMYSGGETELRPEDVVVEATVHARFVD